MSNFECYLKPNVLEWLLEEDNPSVRYLTLANLLDKSAAASDVVDSKSKIMETGVVPGILEKQVGGSWNGPGRFYLDKYKGTVWQLIILAEHGADGENKKIKEACEYILRCSRDPESGGFAVNQSGGSGGGRHSEVIPCLTGNMIWSLIKLGYAGDERVRKGIDWIAEYQRFDDGDGGPPAGWPYDRYEVCWGKHTCHMGAVKALKALSAIPQELRTPAVKNKILEGVEYLLLHRVYKKSHDLSKVSKPGWLKFQFPLMYQTDVLEIASILVDLGVRDERMNDAMDVIVSKQKENGAWDLESTFNGKFQVDIEEKGKPGKWITYRALNVIKKYFSDTI